jgi:Coenzyme PQQ synthesis protein D (PqqD)
MATNASSSLAATVNSAVNARAYRRRPHVLWRRSLGAVLCLPPEAMEPITLAGTGPEVWELLDSPRSLDDLAAELATRHRADPDLIASDVTPVLERLTALGVVEPVL